MARQASALERLLREDFPESELRQHLMGTLLEIIDVARAQRLISSGSVSKFINDLDQYIKERFVQLKQPVGAALPDKIDWPTEQYVNSPESRKKHGILAYLERVWQPLISAGFVDRSTLRKKDPSAGKALSNFQRRGRSIPSHLVLPTKKEMTDRALASNWIRVEDMGRLSQARWRRRVKDRNVES